MQSPSGLAARELAVRLVHDVTSHGVLLDASLARWGQDPQFSEMTRRDRGLARLLAATALRRSGQIRDVLTRFIDKPLPPSKGRLDAVLACACAHLLFLAGSPHAVINLAVEQCKRDRNARRFTKLANAVLRRIAEAGPNLFDGQDAVSLNYPDWMLRRWQESYGKETAAAIGNASLREANLDISVKQDAEGWARRLGGYVLNTGSVRLDSPGPVEELEGYADGAWWVQDTAAALPARVLGMVQGLRIADVCAAPGGKSAQLAARGARVTAVDVSKRRMERLRQNTARLGLDVEMVADDVLKWAPAELFDAVLLDAPCTATGTIRRHPDLLHLKMESDIARLSELQQKLLDHVAGLVKPGGRLVYCTCSLELEEGDRQISYFLERHREFRQVNIDPVELGGEADWATGEGALRTLPCHVPGSSAGAGGMDGFFIALVVRE